MWGTFNSFFVAEAANALASISETLVAFRYDPGLSSSYCASQLFVQLASERSDKPWIGTGSQSGFLREVVTN